MGDVSPWPRAARAIVLTLLLSGLAFALPSRGLADPSSRSPQPTLAIAEDGRVTASLREVPLSTVLELIARKANIKFNDTHISLSYPVSAEFRKLPLDQALKVLLREESYLLVYSRTGDRVRLQNVWVLGRGKAWALPTATGEFDTLRVQARSLDPSVRDLALIQLGMRAETEALEILLGRVSDPAPDVRRTVVGALTQSPHPKAVDALATVLTSDRDPAVRQVAAAALASRGGPVAEHALRLGLEDEAPYIRMFARSFLEQLEGQSAARAGAD